MEVVSFSQACNDLKSVCDRVVDDADTALIFRDGAENIVVMSEDYFNGLQETARLLRSPRNAQRLADAVKDADSGDFERHDLIDA